MSLNNSEVTLALRGTLEWMISKGHFHSKLFLILPEEDMLTFFIFL